MKTPTTIFIEPGRRCTLCPRCSFFLTTAQERKDGLCASCADQPAAAVVHPAFIVDWAMKKVRAEGKPEHGPTLHDVRHRRRSHMGALLFPPPSIETTTTPAPGGRIASRPHHNERSPRE
jgi:hypothetical protein